MEEFLRYKTATVIFRLNRLEAGNRRPARPWASHGASPIVLARIALHDQSRDVVAAMAPAAGLVQTNL